MSAIEAAEEKQAVSGGDVLFLVEAHHLRIIVAV
jgi:hypothetical protein